MSAYDWILGLGIAVGLGLLLNRLTANSFLGFLAYFGIASAFMVFIGFLDLWVLVADFILILTIVYLHLKQRRGIV